MDTPLAATGALERRRNRDMSESMDAWETLLGKRNRAMDGVAHNSDDFPGTQERRCRAGGLHLASVADKGAAKGQGQWRKSELKARWDATHGSAVEGAGAAISA